MCWRPKTSRSSSSTLKMVASSNQTFNFASTRLRRLKSKRLRKQSKTMKLSNMSRNKCLQQIRLRQIYQPRKNSMKMRRFALQNFSMTRKNLSKMQKSGAKKSESTGKEPRNKNCKIRGKQIKMLLKKCQKRLRMRALLRVSLKNSMFS